MIQTELEKALKVFPDLYNIPMQRAVPIALYRLAERIRVLEEKLHEDATRK